MSISTDRQPVEPHLRSIPETPWSRVGMLTLMLSIVAVGGWEGYWRIGREFVPTYRDDVPHWALVRRNLEREATASTAIIGSSRVLFDLNLETWQRQTGHVPFQLALAGTDPRPFLKHLATESDFAGLLLVGVTPPLFFTPPSEAEVYAGAADYYKEQSPSQRIGYRISRTIEPFLAFYHYDTALLTALRRQAWWPEREGYQAPPRFPRRLDVMRRNRQIDMFHLVEEDSAYAALAQDIWRDYLYIPVELPPPEIAQQMLTDLMNSVAADVRLIRERGGDVVFLRMPSTSEFREVERQGFPREIFWDGLLRETGTLGIHFEDHPALQDVRVPEWSHIHSDDTDRFTADLITILRDALNAAGTPRPELGS